MDRKPLRLAGFLLALLSLSSNAAGAADLLGLYAGAAVGEGDVNSQQTFNSVPLDFDAHHNAWKVMLGVRPISWVGAEIEYVDFGQPHRDMEPGITSVKDKAAVLSGLFYVPLPVPYFDVFGKVGLARLQNDVTAHFPYACPVGLPNCGLFQLNRTDTQLAYGGGAQIKVQSLSVRVEYQRIQASNGNPEMFSLGLTWSF
jgi:opacity protein-like surface antigen